MVKRVVGTQTFTLGYNAENQMTSVSGAARATFTYDGNGARVKGVVGSATTVYISNYFEWTGSTATMIKYYYAGAARVAMRTGNTTQQTANLNYLLADHLGSTGKTADAAGATIGEQRYKAWGETRFSSGTVATTFQYTGQRNQVEIGLYFYGARWWDPALGRFTSADTIIPEASQGVQAWDRYAGMNNNAVRYNDPSGHCIEEGDAPPGATTNNICPQSNSNTTQSVTSTQQSHLESPDLDYHQCQVLCHQGSDPGSTNYVDLRTDLSKVDWLSVSSNGLGLLGDALTAFTLLDGPIFGDEILASGFATYLNSVTVGLNIYGVGVDIYQTVFEGQNPLAAIRDGALTVATLPKVLSKIATNVPVLGKILPVVSLPFHVSGLYNAFSNPDIFQIVPSTGP